MRQGGRSDSRRGLRHKGSEGLSALSCFRLGPAKHRIRNLEGGFHVTIFPYLWLRRNETVRPRGVTVRRSTSPQVPEAPPTGAPGKGAAPSARGWRPPGSGRDPGRRAQPHASDDLEAPRPGLEPLDVGVSEEVLARRALGPEPLGVESTDVGRGEDAVPRDDLGA